MFIKFLLLIVLLTCSLHAAPSILIARGQHRKGSPAQAELSARAQNMSAIFSGAGIKTATLDESELSSQSLRQAKLLILPYNPTLQPSQLDAIEAFVKRGGKLMVFFTSNPRLLNLLGLKPADFISGDHFGKPATIQLKTVGIPGLPTSFPQASWNGVRLKPQGRTTIIGHYMNQQGEPTGFPAITSHPHGFAFAHILLNHKDRQVVQAILALAATADQTIQKHTVLKLIQETGIIGGATDLEQLGNLIPAARRSQFLPALRQTSQNLQTARNFAQRHLYAKALPYAQKAYQDARKIYLLSRTSKPGELRGVWIHSAYGIDDWGWDRTIKVLKDCGFNAVFPNMLWGYVADFNSHVLPIHPDVKTKGDQLKQCIDACRKYGVEIHVWKVCWNMGHRTPKNLRDYMKKLQRTQVTLNGNSSDFLAPHIRENQRLEVNSLVDLVRHYHVDGIHLDYIRYPGANCDFSLSAKSAFERYLGKRVDNWPRACTGNGPFRKQYRQWRLNNINQTVREIRRSIRAVNPRVKVSAAVFGGWENATQSIAQDARTWIRQGWIDFVCPMNYSSDSEEFTHLTEQQIEAIDNKVPIYPGIGSWLTPDPAAVAEQIEAARKLGAEGFLCFKLDRKFALETMPALAWGTTSTAAHAPFPHHSPKPVTRFAQSKVRGLNHDFAFPEQVTAVMAFPKGFAIPRKLKVRLILNGHYLPPRRLQIAARQQGQIVACAFLPPTPGTYRIELSDDMGFASQSPNVTVLSPSELRNRLLREGLPQFAKNGRPRVAIWQDRSYGAKAIAQELQKTQRYDLTTLYNLKPETLNACHLVIIPQPRRNSQLFRNPQTAQQLHEYIQRGGSVLVTHALVGIRNFPVICPHVIGSALETPLTTSHWKPNSRHPISRTLPSRTYQSSFSDMIAMTPGPKGCPIAHDAQGKHAVALAGHCGKGRFIAMGLGWGIGPGDRDTSLADIDRKMLLNAVEWMLKP